MNPTNFNLGDNFNEAFTENKINLFLKFINEAGKGDINQLFIENSGVEQSARFTNELLKKRSEGKLSINSIFGIENLSAEKLQSAIAIAHRMQTFNREDVDLTPNVPISWRWTVQDERICDENDPHNWDEVYRRLGWWDSFGTAIEGEWNEMGTFTWARSSGTTQQSSIEGWVQTKFSVEIKKEFGFSVPYLGGLKGEAKFSVETGVAMKWIKTDFETFSADYKLDLLEKSRVDHWNRFTKADIVIIEINRCCLPPQTGHNEVREWIDSVWLTSGGGNSGADFCKIITSKHPKCLICHVEPFGPKKECLERTFYELYHPRDNTVWFTWTSPWEKVECE